MFLRVRTDNFTLLSTVSSCHLKNAVLQRNTWEGKWKEDQCLMIKDPFQRRTKTHLVIIQGKLNTLSYW